MDNALRNEYLVLFNQNSKECFRQRCTNAVKQLTDYLEKVELLSFLNYADISHFILVGKTWDILFDIHSVVFTNLQQTNI